MKIENVDLDGLVLGRAASIIAQKLLAGYNVNAYNAEKLFITGSLSDLVEKYTEKLEYCGKGDPTRGPKYSRLPHLIFKRTIRNMVPHKKAMGQAALKRFKAFIGNAEKVKLITYDDAKIKSGIKKVKLGDLSIKLGAKW